MVKLSGIVRQELEQNAYLLDILQSGFGNISAVAGGLKKRIESKCKKKITVPATSMCIRRYLKQNKPRKMSTYKLPIELCIKVLNGMNEITLPKKSEGYLESLQKIALLGKIDFSIVEGQFETLLFFKNRYLHQIRNSVDISKSNVMISGLSCISVQWPAVTKDIPGIYYKVARALAIRDISVQSLHTIGSEMMIVVKSEFEKATSDALRHAL